ncbi:MAG: hypothetical protein DRO12_00920 [Thermoprotei archaeon]|nr:MAG: hypothetical protein DRO12_00920 [Thermoprotei archaeon]
MREIPVEYRRRRPNLTLIKLSVLAALLLAIVVSVLATSISQLGPGEVAVVYDPITRSFSSPIVGPALFLKFPWQGVIKDFHTIDIVDMTSAPDADYPPITALTRDGVEVSVEISFTYEVDPSKFRSLAMNYPRVNYEENRLIPVMRQVVRDVIAKYTVEELIAERDLIAKEIEDVYRSRIAEDRTLEAIVLHEVNLRGIRLPETVKRAIEEKVAAYQRKIAAQYERERILTLANATAQQRLLIAEAEARAIEIRAQALRRAVEMLVEVSNDPELARLYVLMQAVQNTNTTPIIVIGSAQPIIGVGR